MAITITKNRYVIENERISRAYEIEKGRLVSFSVICPQTGVGIHTGTGSELFTLHFNGLFGGETVKASELKVVDALSEESVTGWTLKIFFKSFKVRGCKIDLQYVERLQRMDHYTRVQLALQSDGSEKAVLDHIDFLPIVPDVGASLWAAKLPERASDSAVAAALGQPVFLENLFFSCTFPGALATADNKGLQVRRYYGRSLAELCANGRFVSDELLCGAAGHSSFAQVREGFLRCLKKEIRSDHPHTVLRMDTDVLREEAIQALLEADMLMQRQSQPFVDTVLVQKSAVYPQAGIFECPTEIPVPFRNFCAMVHALGASVGMEIGIDTAAKGLFHRWEKEPFCPADSTALSQLETFVADLCDKCGVTDWAFRVPMTKSCKEKSYAHPRGGDWNLYYYSDLMERWINFFTLLRKRVHRNLHLTLGGAPLSPWLLQWVDMLELPQQSGKPDKNAKPDVALIRAFAARQTALVNALLPLQRICTSGKQDFSNESDARLLALLNGNRFLLEAPLETDALLQFAAAVNFAKSEQNLLADGVLFGADASQGEVFGIAAFSTADGFVALHNPSAAPQQFAFTLEEALGVPQRFFAVGLCRVSPDGDAQSKPFHFGDSVTVTLAPYETQLLQFGCTELPAAPKETEPLEKNETPAPGELSGDGAFAIKVTFGSEPNLLLYEQGNQISLSTQDGYVTFRVGGTTLRSRKNISDVVQICAVREKSGTLKLYLNGQLDNSVFPEAKTSLSPAAAVCFDTGRTKLYAFAPAFDEV